MINREDMLELTRRMTPSRNCFARIAGAYMDAEGFEDGTFNTHFLKLTEGEKKRNLEIAKAIPFAKTNEELKEYSFKEGKERKDSMWPLLMTLKEKGLKDDGLMSVFYELVGESYKTHKDYSIFMFFGSYDIPVKGTDKEWLEGSEEVYDFLVCAISPLEGEYEPGEPEFGFLFPAFSCRSGDYNMIDIYNSNPNMIQRELMEKILGRKQLS